MIVHSPKTNMSPLKAMMVGRPSFLFGFEELFRGYVCFREGTVMFQPEF